MGKDDDSIRVPSKFVVGSITFLLSAAITFNVWAVQSVYARPTEARVKELIDDKSDSPVIFAMLKRMAEDIREIKELLKDR